MVVLWDNGKAIAAEIIDYKTDDVADYAAAESRANYYADQLRAYRDAIGSMLQLEQVAIRTRLFFTQLDTSVRVNS